MAVQSATVQTVNSANHRRRPPGGGASALEPRPSHDGSSGDARLPSIVSAATTNGAPSARPSPVAEVETALADAPVHPLPSGEGEAGLVALVAMAKQVKDRCRLMLDARKKRVADKSLAHSRLRDLKSRMLEKKGIRMKSRSKAVPEAIASAPSADDDLALEMALDSSHCQDRSSLRTIPADAMPSGTSIEVVAEQLSSAEEDNHSSNLASDKMAQRRERRAKHYMQQRGKSKLRLWLEHSEKKTLPSTECMAEATPGQVSSIGGVNQPTQSARDEPEAPSLLAGAQAPKLTLDTESSGPTAELPCIFKESQADRLDGLDAITSSICCGDYSGAGVSALAAMSPDDDLAEQVSPVIAEDPTPPPLTRPSLISTPESETDDDDSTCEPGMLEYAQRQNQMAEMFLSSAPAALPQSPGPYDSTDDLNSTSIDYSRSDSIRMGSNIDEGDDNSSIMYVCLKSTLSDDSDEKALASVCFSELSEPFESDEDDDDSTSEPRMLEYVQRQNQIAEIFLSGSKLSETYDPCLGRESFEPEPVIDDRSHGHGYNNAKSTSHDQVLDCLQAAKEYKGNRPCLSSAVGRELPDPNFPRVSDEKMLLCEQLSDDEYARNRDTNLKAASEEKNRSIANLREKLSEYRILLDQLSSASAKCRALQKEFQQRGSRINALERKVADFRGNLLTEDASGRAGRRRGDLAEAGRGPALRASSCDNFEMDEKNMESPNPSLYPSSATVPRSDLDSWGQETSSQGQTALDRYRARKAAKEAEHEKRSGCSPRSYSSTPKGRAALKRWRDERCRRQQEESKERIASSVTLSATDTSHTRLSVDPCPVLDLCSEASFLKNDGPPDHLADSAKANPTMPSPETSSHCGSPGLKCDVAILPPSAPSSDKLAGSACPREDRGSSLLRIAETNTATTKSSGSQPSRSRHRPPKHGSSKPRKGGSNIKPSRPHFSIVPIGTSRGSGRTRLKFSHTARIDRSYLARLRR